MKLKLSTDAPNQPLFSSDGSVGIGVWGISLLKSDTILASIYNNGKTETRIAKGMKDILPKS